MWVLHSTETQGRSLKFDIMNHMVSKVNLSNLFLVLNKATNKGLSYDLCVRSSVYYVPALVSAARILQPKHCFEAILCSKSNI